MDLVMFTKVIQENVGRSKAAREAAEANAEFISEKVGSLNILLNL